MTAMLTPVLYYGKRPTFMSVAYGLGMIHSSPKILARKRAMTPRSRGLGASRSRAAAMADMAKS
jgi:hypothetical protein